eukprot:394578-Amphidinium_carterae.1
MNAPPSLLSPGVVCRMWCSVAAGKELPRVPFHDSKLTLLLQPALSGQAATAVIICCNPEEQRKTLFVQQLVPELGLLDNICRLSGSSLTAAGLVRCVAPWNTNGRVPTKTQRMLLLKLCSRSMQRSRKWRPPFGKRRAATLMRCRDFFSLTLLADKENQIPDLTPPCLPGLPEDSQHPF